jgi:hypothetical protein
LGCLFLWVALAFGVWVLAFAYALGVWVYADVSFD